MVLVQVGKPVGDLINVSFITIPHAASKGVDSITQLGKNGLRHNRPTET
jgi:hypothetical protein